MRAALSALLLISAWTSTARAQPNTPPVADPWHAYLVEGRVVDASGAPAPDVVVERVRGTNDGAPYAEGAYRAITDAEGRFRFAFSGLGWPTGRVWFLAARGGGCPGSVTRVELGTERIDGWDADVRRDVVLWLPSCAVGPPPETPAGRAQLQPSLSQMSRDLQACAGTYRGPVRFETVFEGRTGRALEVTVEGVPPAFEATRACLERVARTMRVPPFTRPTFTLRWGPHIGPERLPPPASSP
jgi:hypothetical protein